MLYMKHNQAAITGEGSAPRITMADVAAAKARVAEAGKTRSGVSTQDFILSQVDGKSRTIEMAQDYLAAIAKAEGSK